MSITCVDHFNNFLKEFIENIVGSFPEYEGLLEEYYDDLLTNDSKDSKYVKRFMKKTLEHKDLITRRDSGLFENDIYLLKNVNFKELWNKDNLSESNKNKIWDHIQHLYLLGSTMIGNTDKVKEFVNSIKDEDTESQNPENDLVDIFKSIQDNKALDIKEDDIPESIFSNGLIGNLAKELADDINVNDLDLGIPEDGNVNDIFSNLMSGDNPSKFMNLLTSVGQKIQDKVSDGGLDESKLVDEANTLMDSLKGSNPLLNNLVNMTKQQQGRFNQEMEKNDRQNTTRDRLRKKLEKKKQNKE